MNQTNSKRVHALLHYQKYLGMFLVVVGLPVFIFLPPSNVSPIGPEWPLLLGLFTILFSREKVEDERSASLRTTSLTIAFLTGYVFELITSFLYAKGFISGI
jgi:hypothetical protein